jgi:hypothetical protein
MTQRPLNSAFNKPSIARDGASKNIPEQPAITHGMRARNATDHPLAFDGAKRPLDDEPLQKSYESKAIPINPGTHPSLTKSTQRGNPGDGSAELHSAARLGKPINDPANGQKYDGVGRPITSRD